jgi:hypothetical protein
MAESDIQLLRRCADFTLSHLRQAEERVIEELQTSAATSLVMALRVFRLQRAVLAIGMFSLFESLLQDGMSWKDPFKRLPGCLKARDGPDLSQTFEDYRDAINVLKHGKGKSYKRLMPRANELEFKVRLPDEDFFEEGDVSEVQTLVDVDDRFVRRCAEVIEEITSFIRVKENVWL